LKSGGVTVGVEWIICGNTINLEVIQTLWFNSEIGWVAGVSQLRHVSLVECDVSLVEGDVSLVEGDVSLQCGR
jgi:hypothetical protein